MKKLAKWKCPAKSRYVSPEIMHTHTEAEESRENTRLLIWPNAFHRTRLLFSPSPSWNSSCSRSAEQIVKKDLLFPGCPFLLEICSNQSHHTTVVLPLREKKTQWRRKLVCSPALNFRCSFFEVMCQKQKRKEKTKRTTLQKKGKKTRIMQISDKREHEHFKKTITSDQSIE